MAELGVKIRRDAKISLRRFTDYFKGFEKVEAVKWLFDSKTEKVLDDLKVEFFSRRGYMGVSDEDGHIGISAKYLSTADERWIYLDIIHELVHVKQFMDGKELFDHNYSYVDRPTEIEAYTIAVNEARRIGLSDKEIMDYLRIEWMEEEDLLKLARATGVTPS